MQNCITDNFFEKTEGYHSYLEKKFGIQLRALVVKNLLGEIKNSDILDVGCGDGSISLQFADLSNYITLIDTSLKMIEVAKKNSAEEFKNQIKFINTDFDSFSSGSQYDVIIMIGVLAHFPSIEGVFNKIYLMLKPGGKCVVQFTDSEKLIAKINYWYYQFLSSCGKNAYAYKVPRIKHDSVIKQIRESSLQVNSEIRYSLMLPGMGRLPDKFLFRFQRASLTNALLSRYGSEVILVIAKP